MSSSAEEAPLRSRRRFLLSIVAASVLASVASLGVSTLIKSPQQVAADAGPPRASVISAPVERRVLKESVILRGTVAPGRTIEVTPAAAAEGRSVITRTTVKKGQRIKAGAVVAEVSGRPVIALTGAIPAYRDIRPGGKGPDVKQLQRALRGIGYSVGDTAGTYGAGTQAAVRKLYEDRGYEAPAAPGATTGEPEGDDSEGGEPEGGAAGEGAGSATRTRAKAKPSVYLKAGEVVYVPRFPARATEVKATLGAQVTGTILKLAAGELEVKGMLTAPDRKLVKPGMDVTIFSEESGRSARGRVRSIGAFTADGGTEGAGHPVKVAGVSQLPERFAGQDVRLTIEAASTGGPVLVVPASAVYGAADGSTQVIKLASGGAQERIAVTTGATGGGFVEVRGDGLAEGDRVVVGK
ncbi:peptidoglycan-binding protein [Spirillospora sp. NPDC048911]|uniref:peptidoglycan-binding protein n=1 Tax=Spirillospora sp. NPDC048911 TaxID=3364527 RepID=UPI0037240A4C